MFCELAIHLPCQEMKTVYRRLASQEASQSSADVPPSTQFVNVQPQEPAYAFWHSPQMDISVAVSLPLHIYQGLASAAKNAQLQVFVLSYQRLTNLPPGTIAKDCSGLLEPSVFDSLLKQGATCLQPRF
jgi:hypothetical protein